MQIGCWKCGKLIDLASGGRVLARDTCPACHAVLHACRNCMHYDPAKHNQCAETRAEWVRDKEASNYCDYFSPNAVLYAGKPPAYLPQT
ncbi:MAG: hypothetical protein DMG21_04045 [Acidobacteria bacterium]|nr:MAG: hypothetical protein DMG21_04045 [Acidobacteriota bacterium]